MASVVLTGAAGFSQEEINEAVWAAFDKLDYDLSRKARLVVIKPNLCYYWDCSTGETTDPRVVSATIDWVRHELGKDVDIMVSEADASAMRTKYAFKMLRYEKLSREKNVRLFNLSEGEIVDKEVLVRGEKIVLPVNKMLLDADLIVNVPKMKFHRAVGFTCALKNMFGAIANPVKYHYHSRLAQVIVGVNKIVKSDVVLVDGVIVAGKTPKKIGVIMASDDALATDLTVARAISYNPSRIEYLKLALEEKIGNATDVNLIENPVRLEDVRKMFPKQNYFLRALSWSLQLKLLRLYSRISGDVIPPVLDEEG